VSVQASNIKQIYFKKIEHLLQIKAAFWPIKINPQKVHTVFLNIYLNINILIFKSSFLFLHLAGYRYKDIHDFKTIHH